MGLYDAWRVGGYPTMYRPLKTAVSADVLEAGLLFAIATIAFSLFLVTPGVRGKQRLFYFLRVTVGVFVLGSVLLTNFGQEWDVAEIHDVRTQYRAGLREHVTADIGAKIGLRSVNITLKGSPVVQSFDKGRVHETINYNERYHWNNLGWTQGRLGFGPFAGLFNQEFRESQLRGAPYPILRIAQYFTTDGGGFRWGRYYRQAGFYTHILVWCAFPLWIIALVLFNTTLCYAGYFSLMTGGCLILGNILYATIRNSLVLEIPFNDHKRLTFHFGWCYWLNLATGIICLIVGLLVVILDIRKPEALATFFDFDMTQEFEEFYAGPEQVKVLPQRRKTLFSKTRSLTEEPRVGKDVNDVAGPSDHLTITESGQFENPHAAHEQRQFRKRSAMVTMQKTKKHKPRPQASSHVPPPGSTAENPDEDNETMAESGMAGESGAVSLQQSGADNEGHQAESHL